MHHTTEAIRQGDKPYMQHGEVQQMRVIIDDYSWSPALSLSSTVIPFSEHFRQISYLLGKGSATWEEPCVKTSRCREKRRRKARDMYILETCGSTIHRNCTELVSGL